MVQSSHPLLRNDSTLSRRTVVAGIAWSVPVIAIATATPAFAASPGVGPITVLPTTFTSAGGSLTQASGTGFLPGASDYIPGSAPAGSFTSGSDTNGQLATVTALYTFNAVKGATYSVSISVITQYGLFNSSTSSSERQSLDVTLLQGGTSTVLAKVSVSHSNRCTRSDATMAAAGYTLQAPSQGTKSYTDTFTASVTGAVTVQCLFTLDARRSGNHVNDDMRVTPPLVTRLS